MNNQVHICHFIQTLGLAYSNEFAKSRVIYKFLILTVVKNVLQRKSINLLSH